MSEVRLELWSDLPQLGGARLAADIAVGAPQATYREGGDNSLTFRIAAAHPAANLVDTDLCVVLYPETGNPVAWIVGPVSDSFDGSEVEVACGPARNRLRDYAVDPLYVSGDGGYSPTAFSMTYFSTFWVIAAWWPSFVILGTIDPSGFLNNTDLSLSPNDDFLSVLLQLVARVQAELAPGAAPCIMELEWVSISQMRLNIRTAPVASTIHLCEGKNLRKCTRKRDMVDGVAIVGYVLDVIDLTRTDAATFAADTLAPYRNARFEVPSRGWAATLRITEIIVDYSDTTKTQVTIGTVRRPLAQRIRSIESAVRASVLSDAALATGLNAVAVAASVAGSVTIETQLINTQTGYGSVLGGLSSVY